MLPWEELTCWMHILHAVSFPSGPVAGIWYFFWHLSVAVINAWLLYQRDCEAQGIPTSKVLKLRKFQGLVAEGLFQVGTVGVGQQLLASPPRHHKNLFEFTRVQMFVSTKSSIGLSRRNIAIIELCARTSKLICSDCENCASCSFVSNWIQFWHGTNKEKNLLNVDLFT